MKHKYYIWINERKKNKILEQQKTNFLKRKNLFSIYEPLSIGSKGYFHYHSNRLYGMVRTPIDYLWAFGKLYKNTIMFSARGGPWMALTYYITYKGVFGMDNYLPKSFTYGQKQSLVFLSCLLVYRWYFLIGARDVMRLRNAPYLVPFFYGLSYFIDYTTTKLFLPINKPIEIYPELISLSRIPGTMFEKLKRFYNYFEELRRLREAEAVEPESVPLETKLKNNMEINDIRNTSMNDFINQMENDPEVKLIRESIKIHKENPKTNMPSYHNPFKYAYYGYNKITSPYQKFYIELIDNEMKRLSLFSEEEKAQLSKIGSEFESQKLD